MARVQKILIVDDERFNINVLTGLLKPDYKLMAAKNGLQALKAVKIADPPDLILLDVMMPEMDGYETCRQLKADPQTAEIPIIFITAKVETADILNGFELGAVDYVSKPFNPKELLARVKTHLQLKAAQQQIRESEERFRSIIELAHDAIVVVNSDLKIEIWNTGAVQIFGYTKEEMGAQPLLSIITDTSATRYLGVIETLQDTASSVSGKIMELLGKHKNGREIPIELSVGVWETGGKSYISNIVRDLTERKNMETQMVQNEKMAGLGTLVAGVAHEINNPVNFVHMNVHNLKSDLGTHKAFLFDLLEEEPEIIAHLTEEFGKFNDKVGDIIEGSERIKTIVNDLRTFSRLDEAEKKVVKITEGIDSTLRLVKAKYKKEVEFLCDFQTDLEVECWAAQLNQVFMNIMVNACQAILDQQRMTKDQTPGKLTLQTFLEGRELGIRFMDTGSGMSEETRQKIFEPFYTTKSVGEGTGMGMAISYGIIEKHQGRLEVESTLGEGTTITVFLPQDPN